MFNITCRAVNLKKIDATANDQLAYELQHQLTNSPMFDAKETKLSGPISGAEGDTPDFSFGVTLKLKRPLKL